MTEKAWIIVLRRDEAGGKRVYITDLYPVPDAGTDDIDQALDFHYKRDALDEADKRGLPSSHVARRSTFRTLK